MDIGFLAAFAGCLLVTGALAGVLAGLLGVGGGIVIVPVLFQGLTWLGVDADVRMHLTVGTSLMTIVATSLASARAHHRRGALDTDLMKTLAGGVLLGAGAGVLVGTRVTGEVLTAVFAVVALLVAINMALRPGNTTVAAELPRGWPRWAVGGVIGGFSVIMGIGGGTLSVPLLTAFAVPIRRAVATASAIGFLIAVPGAIGFALSGWGRPDLPPLSLGYVNLIGFALITPLSVACAPLGARLAHSLPPTGVRLAFAGFLLATAVRMGWDVLG
ncbi:hypothetical protein CKO28_06750 [Rhodovibrio sodomensis]|uniref:Probable membrane transporter protein n=1 Tax=Rhodovibrio sodomensis TaxID=1088 RepID=A0ABS1DCR8_9PROT|nr:sulfite exporter TauE/SafE family protein [Rhodovibrio sodomensis]MBK1667732.1 hypothetical protein [Rhodovibrio sodomensis]